MQWNAVECSGNGMGMEWEWSAIWDTWRQMTEFTLQPKDAETAWEASPRGLKRAEKEERRDVRGRSSLTTTHMRTHDKLIPLDFRMSVLLPSSRQQTSRAA